MPSLAKTLCRWYWTVRALMNSRAPISGLDRPSLASRATWASWVVSTSLALAVRAAGAVRLRAVSPVAAPRGERRNAHLRQHLGGGAQLPPRLPAPPLPAQPLPV